MLGTSLGQQKILNIDSGTIIRSISSGDRVILNLATEGTEKLIASASYNTIRWKLQTRDGWILSYSEETGQCSIRVDSMSSTSGV